MLDGNVVDVQLLSADQVQKKIEGPLEHVEVHLVVFRYEFRLSH